MSATNSSSDKYLFLFTTDSDDLSNVKTAFQEYYSYPVLPTNTFEATGCANFKSTYLSLIERLCGTDPTSPVYREPDAAGKVPAGETKMNTLVVVISGNSDTGGLGLVDSLNNTLTWAELRQTIFGTIQIAGPPKTYPYQLFTEIHVIFASPYCSSFRAEWDGNIPISNGTLIIPETVSNDIDQAGREAFLNSIANELKLNTTTGLDNYGRISFNDIAASIHGGSAANYFRTVGSGVGGKYFPGFSELEIDDGTPSIYKTEDIWLNDYDPQDPATVDPDLYDNYEYDHDNKISVRVHVRGTHPVRDFYVGVGVFRSGGGGECDVNPLAERHVTPAIILKPGDTDIYSYDEYFEPIYSHRCIKARVSMLEITDADIDNASDWAIAANRNEAQLNIDPGGVAKMAIGGGGAGEEEAPDQGEGKVDEENPGADAEENETGDGSKSIKNLRGYLEHEYLIRNDFKTKMEFLFKIPDEVYKYEKLFKCRWFRYHPKYPEKMQELILKDSHTPGFIFKLNPGEEIEILFYLALRKGANVENKINLPFDILVKKPDRAFLGIFKFRRQPLKLHSGVNLALINASGDIVVRVSDEKKKGVPDAYVFIKTLNGRQSAVIKTDKEGNCKIPQINAGPYKLWAKKGTWKTGVKVVNLKNKKTEKVELLPEHEKK